MDSIHEVYRGYDVYIVGKDASWSFRAQPQRAELSILSRALFPFYASPKAAFADATRQIDCLLDDP
jgi:hypothetical protein